MRSRWRDQQPRPFVERVVRQWAEFLAASSRGFENEALPFDFQRKKRQPPSCSCGQNYPIGQMPLGQHCTVNCACGATLTGSPAPSWLQAVLPCARGVYGAGEQDTHAQVLHPMVMACPSCGGGLQIDKDVARISACKHCSKNVFLPQELWSHFHPKRPATRWWVVYEAPMMTADEIRRNAVVRPFKARRER
jgi:hypothetical protein